jgi:hypothetical protein
MLWLQEGSGYPLFIILLSERDVHLPEIAERSAVISQSDAVALFCSSFIVQAIEPIPRTAMRVCYCYDADVVFFDLVLVNHAVRETLGQAPTGPA